MPGLIAPKDTLANGIWPQSWAVKAAILYLAVFIIRPWEKLIPELAPLHFERWCAIAMLLVVAGSGRARLRFDQQTVAVLLFGLATGFSGGGTEFPMEVWFIPYTYLTLMVVYLVLMSVIRTPYELLFVVASYIAIMLVYLAKSQWEFFVHGAGISEMGVRRMQGIDLTYGNDNAVAASVTYSIPFLYLLYSLRHELTASWPPTYRRMFRPFLILYTVLAISSVFLTRSRTGFIVLLFSGLLLANRKAGLGRKFLALFALGALSIVIFAFLPVDAQGRIRSIWNHDYDQKGSRESTEGRWRGFQAGLIMLKEHPVTGVGLGNFAAYRTRHIEGEYGGILEAHNLIGELLGETGLFGAATFTYLVVTILLNSRKTRKLANAAGQTSVTYSMAQVGLACRDVVILLFVFGFASHNLDRFNWLWAGAFCQLAVHFSQSALEESEELNELEEWEDRI